MTDNPEDKIVQLMREIEEMRLLLSGRTMSCDFCNEMAKQRADMADRIQDLEANQDKTVQDIAWICDVYNIKSVTFEMKKSVYEGCEVFTMRSNWKGATEKHGITHVDVAMAMLDKNITQADIVRREIVSHTLFMRDEILRDAMSRKAIKDMSKVLDIVAPPTHIVGHPE